MAYQLQDKIVGIEQLTEDIFKMTVESERISETSVPGQFVNIKCCEGTQALLRRPISICSVDRKAGTYELLFQRKGNGTELLACKSSGDTLDVLGPLGNGFDLDIRYRRIVVIGGGIGIFPLLFVLHESKSVIKRAYLGFRTKELVVLENEFRTHSITLDIATDDGSYGERGFVTDILARDLTGEKIDMIYACGPTGMLKNVVKLAHETETACQISLEQRMGCGFGTCLVCACKTHANEGGWQYSHVCKDGPIFNSRDVIFE